MSEELPRKFRFTGWANRAVHASLTAHGAASPAKAVQIFGHILAAEQLWMARYGRPPIEEVLPLWPDWPVERLTSHVERFADEWPGLVAEWRESDPDLARRATYVNFLGDEYTTRLRDALEHLVHHGVYHRGQIATLLGQAGLASPNTDFIQFVRLGEPAS